MLVLLFIALIHLLHSPCVVVSVSNPAEQLGSIRVNNDSQLEITPPMGYHVEIRNLTALAKAQAELSVLKETFQQGMDNLTTAAQNLDMVLNALAQMELEVGNLTGASGQSIVLLLAQPSSESSPDLYELYQYAETPTGPQNWSTTEFSTSPEFRQGAAGAFCTAKNSYYLAGGDNYDSTVVLSTVSRLSLYTFRWTQVASMSKARVLSAGVCDGVFLMVAGGIENNNTLLASCEIYDTIADKWKKAANMSRPRSAHALVSYMGNPIVLGGIAALSSDGNPPQALNSAELYNSEKDQWDTFPSFKTTRVVASAAVLMDMIYLTGGFVDGSMDATCLDSVEVFNGTAWSILSSVMPGGCRGSHVALVFQNKLTILAGYGSNTVMTQVDVYDPLSNGGSWSTPIPAFLVDSVLAAAFVF